MGSDEATDITLLQVEATGLTALPLGDSAALEVGDFVVTVGNPFGLGQPLTYGIVSGVGRTGLLDDDEHYEDVIHRGQDTLVVDLNEQALQRLKCIKALAVVPGATHLSEEPGALDDVCDRATAWFDRHCTQLAQSPPIHR